ncbi:MAG: DNA polymerase III subunit delta' [Crocinitomicaceae bacterium]|nr:DNA polymerase III subunit delta' [Crocinitomicaceae bacterium]
MLFSKVIGQRNLKTHLINEINHEKVSHAQIFLGKPGYGGLPLALAFVQYLFCENRQAEDSCGECASCRKVETYQHPDLHFSFPSVQAISKTSDRILPEWREQLQETPYFDLNTWIKKIDIKERKPIISKDESQEIIKKLSLRSYEGGYKVMMMWMPEEMNVTCANKLLKILEEPPAKTLFILIAESSENMLQTILSRTQVVNIPRIEMDEMSVYFRSDKKMSTANADSLAARVDGDLIEAFDFLGDHLEQDENKTLFIQLMRVCYKKSVLEMMSWAEAIAATSKEHQKVFLKYALHMFRQSMLKNYTEDHLIKVSEDENKFLMNFSKFITGNNIIDFMKTFNDAHYHIERNANSKILFTNLCFQVMRYIHVA